MGMYSLYSIRSTEKQNHISTYVSYQRTVRSWRSGNYLYVRARPPISAEFLYLRVCFVERTEALYYGNPEIQNSAEIGDLACTYVLLHSVQHDAAKICEEGEKPQKHIARHATQSKRLYYILAVH